MKFFFSIVLISVLFPSFGKAQQANIALGSFAMGCKAYNYEFKKLSNGLFTFNISNIQDESTSQDTKTYTLNEFTQKPFIELCVGILKEYEKYFPAECKKAIDFNSLASEIFYEIKIQSEITDDEPITAYLKLKKTIIDCYYSKDPKIRNSKSDNQPILTKFVVDNVDFEFEDGTLKNVFAYLTPIDHNSKPLLSSPICFKNTVPFSVSSRNDNDNFSKYNIYASNFKDAKNKIKLAPTEKISDINSFIVEVSD
ncbi:MAG: hypothetical protein KA138_09255, partial [Saprospiraceae bacterium]|nr:hypothetical protein [Saprospiraceae bacterium]